MLPAASFDSLKCSQLLSNVRAHLYHNFTEIPVEEAGGGGRWGKKERSIINGVTMGLY